MKKTIKLNEFNRYDMIINGKIIGSTGNKKRALEILNIKEND